MVLQPRFRNMISKNSYFYPFHFFSINKTKINYFEDCLNFDVLDLK